MGKFSARGAGARGAAIDTPTQLAYGTVSDGTDLWPEPTDFNQHLHS